MKQSLKDTVERYIAMYPDKSEEEILSIIEEDIEKAAVLTDFSLLMSEGKYKEGLGKIAAYMDKELLKAGVTDETERMKIIRDSVLNSMKNEV